MAEFWGLDMYRDGRTKFGTAYDDITSKHVKDFLEYETVAYATGITAAGLATILSAPGATALWSIMSPWRTGRALGYYGTQSLSYFTGRQILRDLRQGRRKGELVQGRGRDVPGWFSVDYIKRANCSH